MEEGESSLQVFNRLALTTGSRSERVYEKG